MTEPCPAIGEHIICEQLFQQKTTLLDSGAYS